MDCNSCEKRQKQDVPFLVHEADMARMERQNKRVWILCVVLAVLLAFSWLGFVLYEAQYVDESATVEVDTGEGDAYVAGIGDVTVGESESDRAEAYP